MVKHVCALNRKALKRENLRSEITKDDGFYGTSGSSVCDQSSGLMELTCRVEIIFVEVGVRNDLW